MNTCLNCNEPLDGRIDKKFCNNYCKSAYHYEASKAKENSFYQKVDKQLKINRKILKHYNKAGYASLGIQVLEDAGFNPKYFTHYWKNKKGDVYLFCYEFGFIKKTLNSKKKYILIKWQPYMENNSI